MDEPHQLEPGRPANARHDRIEGLTLGEVADVMAHLRYFRESPEHDVLRVFSLSPGAWQAARDGWVTQLGAETSADDSSGSEQFGLAFGAHYAELQRVQPSLASLLAPESAPEGATQTAVALNEVEPSAEVPSPPEEAAEPPLPPLPNQPEMRWARWAGTQGAAQTEDVSVAVFRGAALPFQKGAPSPAFFVTADAATALHGYHATATGHETMLLPVVDARVGDGNGAPAHSVGRAPPSLSLEQYAAFCAELLLFPAQVSVTYLRYGCAGEGGRTALDDRFTKLFATDPNLRVRWQALVVHYEGWYRGNATR